MHLFVSTRCTTVTEGEETTSSLRPVMVERFMGSSGRGLIWFL